MLPTGRPTCNILSRLFSLPRPYLRTSWKYERPLSPVVQSTALTTPSYFERVNAVKSVAMEAVQPANMAARIEAAIPQLPVSD